VFHIISDKTPLQKVCIDKKARRKMAFPLVEHTLLWVTPKSIRKTEMYRKIHVRECSLAKV
jgi:hypothetical protein